MITTAVAADRVLRAVLVGTVPVPGVLITTLAPIITLGFPDFGDLEDFATDMYHAVDLLEIGVVCHQMSTNTGIEKVVVVRSNIVRSVKNMKPLSSSSHPHALV